MRNARLPSALVGSDTDHRQPIDILIVDDRPANLDSLHAVLAPLGHSLVRATSGEEALRYLLDHDPAVILLDVQMPAMNGFETATMIRQRERSERTPIIFLTAVDASSDDVFKGYATGAVDYLLKPFEPQVVRAKVKVFVELSQQQHALRVLNKQLEAERKAIEDMLFTEKERAQVTLNSIGDAVVSTDATGRVGYLNSAAERLTGWSSGDAIDRPLPEVLNIVDATTRIAADDASAVVRQEKTGHVRTNCVLIRRDGAELLIEDSTAPIHDREGRVTGAVIVFRDVTEARAVSGRLTHFSRHDILTDLPNRTLLEDRIGQAFAMASRRGTRLALLFVDLDRFKHVNDSLGHAIGDALLKSVAARLLACLRATDTVSRWGGDEFVVVLTQLDEADTAAVSAAKIITAVSAPYALAGHVLDISASIGIGIWPDDAAGVDELISAADAAMYKAKAHGGNNYQFFTSQLNDQAIARRSLEDSLRQALQRQELTLYYQPKNNLETSRVIGIEALVRWQHSTRGLLAPDQFVTIAEECGLMMPIGRWILREACRQARAWHEAGFTPIPIAVNVSAAEFRSKGFVDGVAIVLRETELAAPYLELEVTESVLMEDTQSTTAVLSALKDMGVRIAIDDFGTGYSSLSYLSRFPIDTLKIDRSFVGGITAAGHDATIINAVIGLGRSLNQHVVAEGVETEQQLALLRRQQCVEGQGYYFSPPIEAEQFTDLLRQESDGPQGVPAPS